MAMTKSTLLVLVVALGCRGREHPVPQVAPALAHATQTDLARELDDADRRGTWSEVRHRWQGQSLHWTVTRQRSLCRSADACNVAAFPIQRPAHHGWLPGLTFAPGEFAKLDATCGAAEQCELTIEGTLSDLQASPDVA